MIPLQSSGGAGGTPSSESRGPAAGVASHRDGGRIGGEINRAAGSRAQAGVGSCAARAATTRPSLESMTLSPTCSSSKT